MAPGTTSPTHLASLLERTLAMMLQETGCMGQGWGAGPPLAGTTGHLISTSAVFLIHSHLAAGCHLSRCACSTKPHFPNCYDSLTSTAF